MTTPPTVVPRVRPPHNPAPRTQRGSDEATPKLHFREQIQQLKSTMLIQNGGPHETSPGSKLLAFSCEPERMGQPACVSAWGIESRGSEAARPGLGPEVDENLRDRDPAEEGETIVENWCDPMARALLQWGPPQALSAPGTPALAPIPSSMLDQIAAQLVRKVGVGPSSVHLQLGTEHLEGGEVLVQSGTDGLDVQVTAPAGVDGVKLGQAIHDRLTRRGLRVARVVVD